MDIRNIAIIAHVDHGKTTLVDALLKQGGAYNAHEEVQELAMDSNDQERERGITIYAKNTSITYKGTKINIVDTPGHADFGSEVERILGMVDCVLLLVDAQEGPMPQTKFVLKKSLQMGIKPIVIINKIDKPAATPLEAVDMVFDLFVALGASNEQLEFPYVFAVAREGIAKKKLEDQSTDLTPLFETIMTHVPPTPQPIEKPFRMQVSSLAYDDYVGRQGIGRVFEGKAIVGQDITVLTPTGEKRKGRISKITISNGLKKDEVKEALAGDIVTIAGIADIYVGETISSNVDAEPLPAITIDPPTISMNFIVNNSPFAGKEGTMLTTRHIRDRLEHERETNVGLHIETLDGTEGFKVSGRGELHLSVLIENMRREGFELQVSRPQVIFREIDGVVQEPMEHVIVDVPEEFSGAVITMLGRRRGEMMDMKTINGQSRMEFIVPTRGLLGFRGDFIIETRGEGILNHSFLRFEPEKGEIPGRTRGSMISMIAGETMAFSLWNLQDRGRLFVVPQTSVYEGMIIGESSKSEDMTVNPIKNKKLTNMRASGTDEAMTLTPIQPMTLEQALEYVADDELVEVTPKNIRLRKKFLKEHERKKQK
ncbi:translational GTPase TypA [Candidatus Peregrinibacteria bacterium]|nr:translational GTPase TypA [Candidatus Peregrinibacteria bacterium]